MRASSTTHKHTPMTHTHTAQLNTCPWQSVKHTHTHSHTYTYIDSEWTVEFSGTTTTIYTHTHTDGVLRWRVAVCCVARGWRRWWRRWRWAARGHSLRSIDPSSSPYASRWLHRRRHICASIYKTPHQPRKQAQTNKESTDNTRALFGCSVLTHESGTNATSNGARGRSAAPFSYQLCKSATPQNPDQPPRLWIDLLSPLCLIPCCCVKIAVHDGGQPETAAALQNKSFLFFF